MLTLAQILAHPHGILHHVSVKNADGTPLRARINGKVQTWKTRPGEFKLPVKHGLRDYFYITHATVHEWNFAD